MIEKLNFNDDTLFNELMRIVESLKVFSNSNSKSTQTSSKRILIGNMIVDVSSPFITLEKSISELLKKIQRFYFEMNEMQKKYSSDGIVSLSSFKKISDSKIIETLKEFHKMLKDKTESIKKTKAEMDVIASEIFGMKNTVTQTMNMVNDESEQISSKNKLFKKKNEEFQHFQSIYNEKLKKFIQKKQELNEKDNDNQKKEFWLQKKEKELLELEKSLETKQMAQKATAQRLKDWEKQLRSKNKHLKKPEKKK